MTEETDKRKNRLSGLFHKKEGNASIRKSHEESSPSKPSQFKLSDSRVRTLPLPSPSKDMTEVSPKKRTFNLNSSMDSRTLIASSSGSSSTDFDGSEETFVPEEKRKQTQASFPFKKKNKNN